MEGPPEIKVIYERRLPQRRVKHEDPQETFKHKVVHCISGVESKVKLMIGPDPSQPPRTA